MLASKPSARARVHPAPALAFVPAPVPRPNPRPNASPRLNPSPRLLPRGSAPAPRLNPGPGPSRRVGETDAFEPDALHKSSRRGPVAGGVGLGVIGGVPRKPYQPLCRPHRPAHEARRARQADDLITQLGDERHHQHEIAGTQLAPYGLMPEDEQCAHEHGSE